MESVLELSGAARYYIREEGAVTRFAACACGSVLTEA